VSLKYRLIAWLTLLTLAVWAAMSLVLYRLTVQELAEVFDAQLAQSARTLMALVSTNAGRGEMEKLQEVLGQLEPKHLPITHTLADELDEQPGAYERLIAYQVITHEGHLRLVSGSAPAQPFSSQTSGFSDVQLEGQRWRVFSLADPAQGLVVHAGEQGEIRDELAHYVVACLSPPVWLAIAALVLGVWLVVSPALRPLVGIVGEIKHRDPHDLKPLPVEPAPREVVPLIDALNSLFLRLQRAIETERAFTGDAAHELRTPLAGLRVQAQVALRATTDEDRRRALRQIIVGVDRASHLVEQLLLLSRLDNNEVLDHPEAVDLQGIAAQTRQDLTSFSSERRVEVHLTQTEPTPVLGDPAYLGVLLRNLLDNAIRYSPEGGEVWVELAGTPRAVTLRVSDSGPGIPSPRREDAFRRFRRLAEAGQVGSGLGLSIVQKIAELHRAEVSLAEPPGGGLRVEVRFPRGAQFDSPRSAR